MIDVIFVIISDIPEVKVNQLGFGSGGMLPKLVTSRSFAFSFASTTLSTYEKTPTKDGDSFI